MPKLPMATARFSGGRSAFCTADETAIQTGPPHTSTCQPGGGFCLGSGNTVANYILENYLIMPMKVVATNKPYRSQFITTFLNIPFAPLLSNDIISLFSFSLFSPLHGKDYAKDLLFTV